MRSGSGGGRTDPPSGAGPRRIGRTVLRCTVVIPGRVIVLSVCWGGVAFWVVNVYGPSDKQDRWDCLHSLSPHLLGRVPLVLAGDFNCILEREVRKGTGDFKFDKSSVLLKKKHCERLF